MCVVVYMHDCVGGGGSMLSLTSLFIFWGICRKKDTCKLDDYMIHIT